MIGSARIRAWLRATSVGGIAAAMALALSACGESHSHSPSQTQAASKYGNASDAGFVASMIPHHESAVEMAKLAQTRAEHPEVKQLAATIIASQNGEIDQMKALQPTLPKASGHEAHMGMSDKEMGMDGDMTGLAKAKPFDRAFLEMMIPHHEGAVRMAKVELAKGTNPQLKELSRQVIDSQSAEITQMRAWLKQWYGVSQSSSGGGHSIGGAGTGHG